MIYVIIIKHSEFSYSSIKSQLFPCATAYGYKFRALAIYLHPTFTAPFQSEAHFKSNQTIAVEFFCGNSQRLSAVGYFYRRAPSQMFDRILNATLFNNLLQLAEGLRKSFPSLGLDKGILDSPCLLILLIYTKHKP